MDRSSSISVSLKWQDLSLILSDSLCLKCRNVYNSHPLKWEGQRRPVPVPLLFSLREMSQCIQQPSLKMGGAKTTCPCSSPTLFVWNVGISPHPPPLSTHPPIWLKVFLQPSKLGKDRKTYLSLGIFYRVVLQVRLVNVVILFLLT
jgi:hypothetical protein